MKELNKYQEPCSNDIYCKCQECMELWEVRDGKFVLGGQDCSIEDEESIQQSNKEGK
tara:strand:- start:3 stop:173 length:171 start_codon:yes stop_codon:yes gene_type:complete